MRTYMLKVRRKMMEREESGDCVGAARCFVFLVGSSFSQTYSAAAAAAVISVAAMAAADRSAVRSANSARP